MIVDKFKVRWRYVKLENSDDSITIETQCYIFYKCETDYVFGNSKCSNKDQFCKKTGRKLSLARAMNENFPKKLRTKFWESYRTMGGKTRWENKTKVKEVLHA